MPRVPRRLLIGSALTSALAVGCETDSPGLSPGNPPRSGQPPKCVTLDDHEFRYTLPCGDGGRRGQKSGGDGEGVTVQIEHYGPIISTGTHFTAYYLNGVVEYDIATESATALFAPKRANTFLYDTRGPHTVVPRCDGVLVVHEKGCITQEMQGHTVGDKDLDGGIVGLHFTADDHLVSLGTDNTLRSWRPSAGEALKSVEVEGGEATALSFEPDVGLVVTRSGGAAIDVHDPETLERIASHRALPGSTDRWLATPSGLFVAADGEAGLVFDPTSGETRPLSEGKEIGTLAVSRTGDVAFLDSTQVWLTDLAGNEHEWKVFTYMEPALAFSPDGTLLHVLDGIKGITTYDVATQERRARHWKVP